MNILQLNFIVILLFGILGMLKSKLAGKFYLFISISMLTVISGLKGLSVGFDTPRYYARFIELLNMNTLEEFLNRDVELSFKLAQKVFQLFSSNFNLWLFIVASFIYILLAINVYNFSDNYFLSIFLFITLGYFHFSLSGIRQTIAIILILSTYKYLINKEFRKFLLVCLIAASFHSSALIFLPVYPLSTINWKRKHLAYLFIFLAFMYSFRIQIGSLLTSIYYESGLEESNYVSTGRIGGLAIVTFLILIWGIFTYNPFRYTNRENRVLALITFLSVGIQILSSFSYLFTRLNMYFMIYLIIYIPFLLKNFRKAPIKLSSLEYTFLNGTITLTMIIVLSINYLNSIHNNELNILPYSFFWQS